MAELPSDTDVPEADAGKKSPSKEKSPELAPTEPEKAPETAAASTSSTRKMSMLEAVMAGSSTRGKAAQTGVPAERDSAAATEEQSEAPEGAEAPVTADVAPAADPPKVASPKIDVTDEEINAELPVSYLSYETLTNQMKIIDIIDTSLLVGGNQESLEREIAKAVRATPGYN